MDSTQITNGKAQLEKLLSTLAEKRTNPFAGTPIDEFRDQIRDMRRKYGLSYADIATNLNQLDIQPKFDLSVAQVRAYCKHIAKSKGGKQTDAKPTARKNAAARQ